MSKQSIKFSLRDMFPNIEEEQLQAIDKKLPIPPSKAWLEAYEAERGTGSTPATVPTSAPLVSCVLVFGEPKRLRLARRAVNNFVQQTYHNKQLIIINTSGQPVTTVPYDPIREIMVSGSLTIGAMRSRGAAEATGTWIKQWDDDDIFNPHLLAYQMAHRIEGKAQLLTTQIRVNIRTATAYLHHQPEGIVNTMLFPRTAYDYPNVDRGEDVANYMAIWSQKAHVVDNSTFPATCLNTVVFHGNNVCPVEQLMPNHTDPALTGMWQLPPRETEYLRAALAEVGLVAHAASTPDAVTQ